MSGETLELFVSITLWVLGGIVVGFCLEILFPLYRISGNSMWPTYHDGEMFLCRRIFRKSKIRCGDVICYKAPEGASPVIKRVTRIKYKEGKLYFFCEGDNYKNSYDSRKYGFVSEDNIICRLPERYQRPNLYPC